MGELNFALFMNTFMMSMLAKADFLNVDVTFTKNKEFPYLLNTVAFNCEVLQCKYTLTQKCFKCDVNVTVSLKADLL